MPNDLAALFGLSTSEADELRSFNDTDAPFDAEALIDELILAAAIDGHTDACSFEGQRMKRQAFLHETERLAGALQSAGLQPHSVVVIALPPSPQRLMAVLAVLRCGCAFLPLDKDHPEDRLNFQLKDSGAQLVISEENSVRINVSLPLLTLPLADDTQTDFHPVHDRSSADWAYIIYTSGSTGRPKAAATTHRALVNRLQWMAAYLSVTPSDRICHKTSFGFDVSVWEQLLPLMTGSCAVIAPDSLRSDPEGLGRLIRNEGITLIHFVPTMLAAFTEYGQGDNCRSLRAIIASGEELPRSTALAASKGFNVPVYNLYGPTEAAIDVSAWRFSEADEFSFVPIGRPIQNVKLHVLDAALEQVPVGVTGELYIGGEAPGAGYLSRPGLTAEKFIPDPFSEMEGCRLYRTGDLARFHEGGIIEFLGRTDHQVKIRGFRIETGEIEEVLRSVEDVAQSAVLAHTTGGGAQQLLAYVVGRSGVRLQEEKLRARLLSKLPAYMQPFAIIQLDALPMTGNGKLDRKALPIPVQTTVNDEALESSNEKTIAAIWEQLLKCKVTSANANFFAHGGDSISAIRVVIAASRKGLLLTVKDIFDFPVLCTLAAAARAIQDKDGRHSPLARAWLDASEAVRRAAAPLAIYTLDKDYRTKIISRLHWLAAQWSEAPPQIIDNENRTPQELAETLAAFIAKNNGAGLAAAIVEEEDKTILTLCFEPAWMDSYSLASLPQLLLSDSDSAWFMDNAPVALPDSAMPDGNDPFKPLPLARLRKAMTALAFALPSGTQHLLHRERRAEALIVQVAQALLDATGVDELQIILPESRSLAGNKGYSDRELVGRIAAVAQTVISRQLLANPLAAVRHLALARAGKAHLETSSSPHRLRVILHDSPATDLSITPMPKVEIAARAALNAGTDEVLLVIGNDGLEWRWDAALGEWPATAIEKLEREGISRQWIDEIENLRLPADFTLAGLEATELNKLAHRTANAEELYPLSPLQEGLLLRSVYWPGSDAYLNQNVIELTGKVDIASLARAWEAVVSKYGILRTGYVWEDLTAPLQFVAPEPVNHLEYQDWHSEGLDEKAIDQKLQRYLDEDRRQLFDLGRPGLFRLVLARAAADTYFLVWTHHHILLDGWCLALIWGDVFRFYSDFAQGLPAVHLPVRPYRDYIAWTHEFPPDGNDRAFWRQTLEGFNGPTFFSAQPPHVEGDFVTLRLTLDNAQYEELRAAALAQAVTINAYVQTAWALLLGSRCGATDVVHGVSVSGRPPALKDAEHMVGLFINTIPLRSNLGPRRALGELLRTTQEAFASANNHSALPLAAITTEWKGRPSSNVRLFDNLIAFENYPDEHLPADEVAGIGIRDRFCNEKTEYPIGLIVLPGPPMEFHFNYDCRHFSTADIEGITQDFFYFLQKLVAEPGQKIAALAAPSLTSKQQSAEYLPPQNLPSFQNILDSWRTQTGTALIAKEDELTYVELRNAVLHAAHELKNKTTGDVVGICIERSTTFVVGLLCCWTAGLVPVIINPALPDDTIRNVLHTSGASLLLVSQKHRPRAQNWNIGLHTPLIDTTPAENIVETSIDAAAILLTSGSTGIPKQVILTWAGLINRVQATVENYCLPEPRLLANAAPGFDIGLWEILFPLVQGGTLVLASDSDMLDPQDLCRLVQKHKLSALHLVPSLGERLLASATSGQLASLELFVTGGESVSPAYVTRVRQKMPRAAVWQGYGPTEASISVLDHLCTTADLHASFLPLGKSTKGCTVHILDAAGRPCAAGVTGMIHIGGIALAKGYLGDPRKTAASFIPDPFGPPGSRLYRTGDLARLRPDGALEFIGRNDRQIKVRGHRIEPGQVEHHLARHPLVVQALVTTSEAEETELLGFVTLKKTEVAGLQNIPAILSTWLATQQPPWACPARIYIVDEFPVTPNGKIDREALLHLGDRQTATATITETDLSAEERLIADVWTEILGSPPASRHADFFLSGGHSLSAMRFMLGLQKKWGDARLPVSLLFKYPSPFALSEALSARMPDGPRWLYSIGPDEGVPLVLIHAVEGSSAAYGLLTSHLPNQRIILIDNPRFDQEQGFSSIREMAALYVEWVRAITDDGPLVLGGWSFGGLVALEMARQMADHGRRPETVLLLDSYAQPFNTTDDAGLADGALERLQAHEDLPPALLASLTREIHRNKLLALAAPHDSYEGPVLLLLASEREAQHDLHNGWTSEQLPALNIQHTPGNHHTLLAAGHAPALAQTIEELMQKIQSDQTTGTIKTDESIQVGYNEKPFDIFILSTGGRKLIGRKTPARIHPDDEVNRKKCCLVEAQMILGELLSVDENSEGYHLRYRNLSSEEKDELFAALAPLDDLAYPLRRRIDGRETAQPQDYWTDRAREPFSLDDDEIILRTAVRQLLALHLAKGTIVYDPACSSGTFLADLQHHHPHIHTIGQDLNEGMIDYARSRIDEAYLGNSLQPACGKERADIVLCRHLNLDVVTSDIAQQLFGAAAFSLRPGGLMVVIGHTPVLTDAAWMEAQGFTIVNRLGLTPSGHAAFQLYMLQKGEAL